MRRDHCAHRRSRFRGRLAVSAGGTRILASRLSAAGAAELEWLLRRRQHQRCVGQNRRGQRRRWNAHGKPGWSCRRRPDRLRYPVRPMGVWRSRHVRWHQFTQQHELFGRKRQYPHQLVRYADRAPRLSRSAECPDLCAGRRGLDQYQRDRFQTSLARKSARVRIGGGGEWMFAPHWSVFAEYNFMGFGGSNIQDFTAGVNYKF